MLLSLFCRYRLNPYIACGFIIFMTLFLGGCQGKKGQALPGSGGKTCEIMVVCPKADYETTGIKELVRGFFMETQGGLNQAEPQFTVAHILPEAFEGSQMFMHHRNIIGIEINPSKYSTPVVEAGMDVWASPQRVYWFKVAHVAQFDSLFKIRQQSMKQAFYDKEYVRIQRVFKKTQVLEIKSKLESRYGFSMIFPEGFQMAAFMPDFAWIKKESKHHGQGLWIYTYPYKDDSTFTLSSILRKRNEAASQVPGPMKGSYMVTETSYPEYYPSCRPINLNGIYAIETRGLWKLHGDFMGGPFVNYTLVDTATRRVIMLDAYLYSPKKAKRDLLIQMEAIARSFTLTNTK